MGTRYIEKDPLISVIVVSYNSSKYICKTLNSIYNQTYKNIELIITDDNSADNTIQIANEWLAEKSERFYKTQLITSNINTGIAGNCNRGVSASKGKYLKLIAADDLLRDLYIEKMYHGIIEKGGDIAFCYEYVFFDKDEQLLETEHIRNLEVRPSSTGWFNCSEESKYQRILQANILPAPTAFIKREIFDDLGGFDENYSCTEDYPFWIKALKNRKKFVFVEEYGIYYRKTEESISWRENKKNSVTQQRFQDDLIKFCKEIRDPELIRLGINLPNEKTNNYNKWDQKIIQIKENAYKRGIPRIFRLFIILLSPHLTAVKLKNIFKYKLKDKIKYTKTKYEKKCSHIIQNIKTYKRKANNHIICYINSQPTTRFKKIGLYLSKIFEIKNTVSMKDDHLSKKHWLSIFLKSFLYEIKYLNHKPDRKIKIIYTVHLLTTFSAVESIYVAMLNDSRFEVSLLLVPGRQPGMENYWNYANGLIKYMEDKRYNYTLGYENGKWRNILEFDPDGVFFQTPYYAQRHPIYSPLKTIAFPKIMYTPYGPWVMDKSVEDYISIGIDKPFFNQAWKVFVDKLTYELMEYAAAEYLGKCVLSGSPKIDFHKDLFTKTTYCWKRPSDRNNKKIIWLPRWGVKDGRTSFLDYYEYFIELIENRDINFVMRPHPLLWGDLKRSKIWTDEKVKQIIDAFNTPNNSIIDIDNDYREGILSCDFMVADFSSIIYEYLPTGKPLIYTKKDNTLVDPRIMDACYTVTCQEELDLAISNLMNGHDPLKEKRLEIVQELNYFPNGIENGKYIAEYIAEHIREKH